MISNVSKLVCILIFLFSFSCGKNQQVEKKETKNVTDFVWSENISIDRIPDFPVKGMLNGKALNLEYINFEKWRGSGDNVFNFGDKAPKQVCGFVENDDAFRLTRTNGDFPKGEFIKENFNKNIDSYTADFHYTVDNNIKNVNVPWNCALVITYMDDNTVKGKIALCFKDDAKSWIAGTFEALRCNN